MGNKVRPQLTKEVGKCMYYIHAYRRECDAEEVWVFECGPFTVRLCDLHLRSFKKQLRGMGLNLRRKESSS